MFEFVLASSFWRFGEGSPRALVNKVDADIAKVGNTTTGLAERGYVVIVEECDHRFPSAYEDEARTQHGVEVLFLRQWRCSR